MRALWMLAVLGMLCSCGGSPAQRSRENAPGGAYHDGGGRSKDQYERVENRRGEGTRCCYRMPSLAETYRPTHESINYYFLKLSMQNALGRESESSSSIQRIDLSAFEYGFAPRVIRVRRNDRLIISVTSQDVPHGISISGYRIHVSVKKGAAREVRFTAHRAGEFLIQCPDCVHQGHAGMQAKLIVEE